MFHKIKSFLFRTFAIIAFLSLVCAMVGIRPVQAATLTVRDCFAPSGASERLVEVIAAAGTGDTVNFSCSGTITLDATFNFSKDLTLDGSGQTVVLSGGGVLIPGILCFFGMLCIPKKHKNTARKIFFIGLLALLITSQVSAAPSGTNIWTNLGPVDKNIFAITIDPVTPATLYVGTVDGVFKSTNGGANWAEINTGLGSSRFLALAVNPVTPAILYAGSPDGVFKSINGGEGWTTVNTGLSDVSVCALAINPTASATLYAGSPDGVFKSTDSAASWTAVNNLYACALKVDPATPATLYAGTEDSGVFKSTNAGTDWSEFNNGLTNTTVHTLDMAPTTPSTLYAGTSSGNGGVFAIQQVAVVKKQFYLPILIR